MNVSQIVAIEELESGFQNHKYSAIVILNSNIKIAIEGDLDDTLEVLGVKL